MSGEKGEGTSQERQKEKGTKAVILESVSFFPAVDTTAQSDLPCDLSPILLAGWVSMS